MSGESAVVGATGRGMRETDGGRTEPAMGSKRRGMTAGEGWAGLWYRRPLLRFI